MRKILIVVSILMFGICELSAQKTIYYLVRHAEKDTSVAGATMMQANPPLSEKGIQRSARLASLLEKENIDYIFLLSWNFSNSIILKHKKFVKNGGVFLDIHSI